MMVEDASRPAASEASAREGTRGAGGGGGREPTRETGPAPRNGEGLERGQGGEGRHRPQRLTAGQVSRQVYAESGFLGFYRGFGASVLQFAPTSAVSVRWCVAPAAVEPVLRWDGSIEISNPGCTSSTDEDARGRGKATGSSIGGTFVE